MVPCSLYKLRDARGEDVQRRRRSPRVEGLPAGGGMERVTRKRQREDAPPAGREPVSQTVDDRGVAAMETEGETPVRLPPLLEAGGALFPCHARLV